MRVLVNFYYWFLIEGESFDKFLKSLLFALSASKKWTLAFLLENKERMIKTLCTQKLQTAYEDFKERSIRVLFM